MRAFLGINLLFCLTCSAQLPVIPTALNPASASVGNLVMWVDASNLVFKTDTVTPAGNGDAVGKWGDMSGNNNHLFNTFGNSTETYHVGGAANYLQGGCLTNITANYAQTNTWIMAIQDPNTLNVSVCYFNPGPSGSQFSQWNSSTSPSFTYHIYAGTDVTGSPNPFMSASVFHIVTIQWSGANSFVRVDGTNTWTGLNPGSGGCNGLTMGAFFNRTAAAGQLMQEFRWYNGAILTTSIHTIEQAMGTRWGITVH